MQAISNTYAYTFIANLVIIRLLHLLALLKSFPMYFLIHFLQFNCMVVRMTVIGTKTLPEISISSNRREKRNHLGRSEVYFSATVDLAKARRCFDKEPRYVLRRTHKTVQLTHWTTFSWGALLCLYGAYRYLCVRLVDKTMQLTHWTTFSKGGLLFNRWGTQFYWRGAPFLGSAAVLQERRSVFREVRIFVSPRLSTPRLSTVVYQSYMIVMC